jgi:hypothetical protein
VKISTCGFKFSRSTVRCPSVGKKKRNYYEFSQGESNKIAIKKLSGAEDNSEGGVDLVNLFFFEGHNRRVIV